MRLGQMARKLGVSQAEIVRYLSGQNMGIEEGSNVKLEEQHIRQLYDHFAPTENLETKPKDDAEVVRESLVKSDVETPGAAEDFQASGAPPPRENISISIGDEFAPGTSSRETVREAASNLEPATPANESAETIRATRIELAGLKVIGKIDLPEPKKKENTLSEESTLPAAAEGERSEGSGIVDSTQNPIDERRGGADTNKERARRADISNQDERRRVRPNQQREQRPRKNPITAQREREIEAERERRKEKAAADKERRTQNYHKRVQHSPPTKAVRMFEEPVEELNASSFNEEPTSWFGKLIKWLRG